MGLSVSDQSLFSVLPNWKKPWYEFLFSYGTQAIAIAIFAWVPIFHLQTLDPPQKDYHAIELVPTPVPENHEPQKRLPQPVVEAKLDPPPAMLHLAAPQPQPKPRVEDAPAPEVNIADKKKVDLPPSNAPVIPKQPVIMNQFSTGSSAPQTIAKPIPVQQVQTGGFGDPNGIPARTTQTRAINIAQAGGFDMPTGPGYGNGTGGAKGVRGVVASTGFGGGVAVPPQPQPGTRSAVKTGGFGDSDVPAPPTVQHAAAPVASKMTPAEILSKPLPIYTEEARTKHIEGEVLLEVVFGATGQIHVLRVVRGLGHGLDDAAVKAAEQIRFKPALKDGEPSDSTALVHIIFQLA